MGGQIQASESQPDCFARRLDMLEDVLARKATNTLRARAGAFCSYLSWGYRVGLEGKALLPVLEPHLYDYLTHLRYTGAAPTKAASVMSAIAFVTHCLGAGGSLAST